MFGKIKFISGNVAHVETVCSAEEMGDLMNVHVVFEEKDQAILGEVEEVTDEIIKIRFLGEFRDGRYVSGVIRKPVLSSKIRTITSDELDMIVGVYDETTFKLGSERRGRASPDGSDHPVHDQKRAGKTLDHQSCP